MYRIVIDRAKPIGLVTREKLIKRGEPIAMKKQWIKKILLIGNACLFALNCGTTAVISKKGGEKIEGVILGNDKENVYVQTYGQPSPIKKSEITDIDHPGNGVLVTGIILTAYGILNIAVGAPKCSAEGASFCTGVFTPAAVGVGMSIWGYVVWSGSVNSATDPSKTITATIQPMQMRRMNDETIYYSALTFNY